MLDNIECILDSLGKKFKYDPNEIKYERVFFNDGINVLINTPSANFAFPTGYIFYGDFVFNWCSPSSVVGDSFSPIRLFQSSNLENYMVFYAESRLRTMAVSPTYVQVFKSSNQLFQNFFLRKINVDAGRFDMTFNGYLINLSKNKALESGDVPTPHIFTFEKIFGSI